MPKQMFMSNSQKGFTLIELLISSLIIGITFIVIVNTFNQLSRNLAYSKDRIEAHYLARDLQAEINAFLSKKHDATQTQSGRAAFKNIMDYDNLTNSPPQDIIGNELTQFPFYTRTAAVQRVASDDYSKEDISSNCHKITVTVKKGGSTLTELTWIEIIEQ